MFKQDFTAVLLLLKLILKVMSLFREFKFRFMSFPGQLIEPCLLLILNLLDRLHYSEFLPVITALHFKRQLGVLLLLFSQKFLEFVCF